jgi:hypothetical protein
VLLSMVIIGGLVIVDAWLHKRGTLQPLENWLEHHKSQSTLVVRVAMGATLLLSWQADAMLAPDLKLKVFGHLGPVLEWLQFLLALLLVFPKTTPLAGAGIAALYAVSVWRFGFFYMLDYVHYVGIAVFLVLSQVQSLSVRAVRLPVLYATVGFSLSWLALEKMVYPDWALYLLQANPQLALGLPTDFFLIGAAFVEFSLGYLLIIALLHRPMALVITLVFFTTTLVFGKVEVIGHTSVHAALIVFLLNGSGTVYRAPINFHTRLPWRVAFGAVNFVVVLLGLLWVYQQGAWQLYENYKAALPKVEVAAAHAPALEIQLQGRTVHIHKSTASTSADADADDYIAHIYVNNTFVGSTNGNTFKLDTLPPGQYRVAVTLHDAQHRFVFVKSGITSSSAEPIAAKALLWVN